MKKKNKTALRVLSTATFLAMVASCTVPAFAGTYYLENGDITVNAKEDGNYISQGEMTNCKDEGETIITDHVDENDTSAVSNTVTIKANEGQKANVTLDNVNIDASETGKAAITVSGNSTIELDGNNTLKSGANHAGLEKVSSNDDKHPLTIKDDDNNGKLTAIGGSGGAGIGGKTPPQGYAHDITITGGDITAIGGKGSAGIGGAGEEAKYPDYGCANSTVITISGENTKVTAIGGEGGSGIGAGYSTKSYHTGNGGYLTIKDGAQVTATGGKGAAGIGGGDGINSTVDGGQGFNISITGEGTQVTATGGEGGAGIGGGQSGLGAGITISDGANVTATGNGGGAGIGGGLVNGDSCNSNSGCGGNITISGEGTQVTATGNGGGAGIGGGNNKANINGAGRGVAINITGGTVTATGNDGGAGIGGGKSQSGQRITISGGKVTANGGGGGAGIGTGDASNADPAQVRGNRIQISGGVVTANGGADGGAGIGGGKGTAVSLKNGGDGVTISGGNVTATGGNGAAGIGSGKDSGWALGSHVRITGGTVTATGGAGNAAGIGAGENDAGTATVTINTTGAEGSTLDVTAVAQNDGEAISGESGITMDSLGNAYSGIVRFFHNSTHYNTVHNGQYVGMADNNADEHKETDAHIWDSSKDEILQQAAPAVLGIVRHHCAVDGCKGYYVEFFDYVAPAEPVTPAPTDPDTPDVPGTSDSTPGTPAQDTPADTAVTPDAVQADAAVTPAAAQNAVQGATPEAAATAAVTAAALPQTGANWLAVVGSAISGMFLLAAGFFLDRKRGKNR